MPMRRATVRAERRGHRGPHAGEVELPHLTFDEMRHGTAEASQLADRPVARRAGGRVAGDVEQLGRRQLRVDEAVQKLLDILTVHASQRRPRSRS